MEFKVAGAVTIKDAASMISCALQGLCPAYVIDNTATREVKECSLKKDKFSEAVA